MSELEIRAVNTAALGSADFVHQREFEGTVAVRCRIQAGCVDIVAEADSELLVVEAGAGDNCVEQFAIAEAVSHTSPDTELECLIVAAAVAEQELEGVTYVHLPGRALEEGYNTRAETELLSNHEFATSMESELAVKRNTDAVTCLIIAIERLVCAVQVIESTTEVEVGIRAEYTEPERTGRQIHEDETRIVNEFLRLGFVVLAISVILAWPAEIAHVDAAVAHTEVCTQNEVVGLLAVATHLLGIRTRSAQLGSGELGGTCLVAPECSAHAEIVVAAYRNLLVIAGRIGIVGIVFQNGGPLVAVVGNEAVITVHHASHRRIEVQRTLVKLRKVYVLSLDTRSRQRHKTQQEEV